MLLQLSPLDIIFFAIISAFIITTEVTMMIRRIILRWIYFGDSQKRDFSRYNRVKGNVVRLRKPWDCMKCMTGWCALVLALLAGYNWESIVWWGVGVVAGAIFESIKLKC